jgi:hypothetical protein
MMFHMFGIGGAKCPRCAHKNAGDAGYCERCGMMLGAPRHEAVLVDNRWMAGPDELAVFFGVRELSGIFNKVLRVPAATRAYILQGGQATEVPQGEYEIEGFFTRLNNLLRDQHAEILVTRMAPLSVEFDFKKLMTSEQLEVDARFAVSIKIEQVPAFAQHFMTVPGTITAEHLRELLDPSVRQIAAEFVSSRSLREMARNLDLRPQLDERLHSALKQRLAQFGLAATQVDTLELRHDKYDAQRGKVGSLWLAAAQRDTELEHTRQLDQLYNDEEWQAIWRQEQASRVEFRRAELKQDAAVDQAGLALERAERMQALRGRQIELYGRILEARNKKEALERGAGEVLAELEHEMAKKGAAREDESTEWGHLRALAQLRMRTEMEAAQQDAAQSRQLAAQQFMQRLIQQQVRYKISQTLEIEDETRKRNELVRLNAAEQALHRHQRELDEERHRGALQSLQLQNSAFKREVERVQEFEEQMARSRAREVERKVENADSLAQHEKLLRTIDAEDKHLRVAKDIELHAEQRRAAMSQQAQEAQWQHELRRMEQERINQAARFQHEIARVQAFAGVDDATRLALAPEANAAVLADYLKTKVQNRS